MNGRKWLISDPIYLLTIGFMGLLNYSFDQCFRGSVYLNPRLSLLYVFQYHLILPIINFALISILFYIRSIRKALITKTSNSSIQWWRMAKKGALTYLVPILLILLSLSAPALAKPKSGPAGDSGVAHVLLVDKIGDWESVWPGAFGKVKYQVEGDTFIGQITLHGLKPETEYILTINGQGDTTTDNLIASAALTDSDYPSIWDGWWNGEGYYDFASITSNKGGSLEYKFSATLPTGTYSWVKFLVKDTTLEWETILMEDAALHFTIS